jgi:isopenicillin N synthase-like dioxygenase
MQHIPNVDLGKYVRGEMQADDRREMLHTLAVACEDHGFFLLRGHGREALIEAMFEQSHRFFAQPRQSKLAVARDAANPLGYYDRELTKQKRDLKEVFDFKAGGHQSTKVGRQTRWPEAMPEFREVLTEFFQSFTELSVQTMQMIFTALGMPAAEIETTMASGFGEQHTSAARLNHYPAVDPVPAAERAVLNPLGDMALHHHTDPGAITLLIQDDHGGLQARSKQHGWIDVPPQDDAIVVNIGDVMQVWTNDRCVAGMHRVVPVSSSRGRYSTPFFYQPRFDAVVKPWVAPGATPRYRPFSWRDYIRGRVTDNFADYGVDDVQISRYAVSGGV